MSRRRWLVAYDIGDEVRLRKVRDIVNGHGSTLQYSVFLCDLSKQELIGLKAALREIVHQWEDRVILIDLGDATGPGPEVQYIGQRPAWPATGESVIL